MPFLDSADLEICGNLKIITLIANSANNIYDGIIIKAVIKLLSLKMQRIIFNPALVINAIYNS
jgi:hypothetical protein